MRRINSPFLGRHWFITSTTFPAVWVLILLIQPFGAQSQQSYVPLNRDVYSKYTFKLSSKESSFHTSIKPYLVDDLIQPFNPDSTRSNAIENTGLLPRLKRKFLYENLIIIDSGNFKLKINPLFNFQVGKDLKTKPINHVNTRGCSIYGDIGKHFSFFSSFYENQAVFVNYLQDYVTENYVIPGQGYRKVFKDGFDYSLASGYVSYTPSKFFNFTFGHDKNFIGDGYRSLLLSDNAFNYPFLKISTKIWKIKYVNLYAQFLDLKAPLISTRGFQKKYGTFHFLSWNVTPRWNVGFFESIIWQGSDSIGNRGYDLSYLNPIIFLRPVEFSIGSPDNALMGINTKYKITNNAYLYGQVLIDEFVMKEIIRGNGWWANKYGFQIGGQVNTFLWIKNLSLNTEFNYVRPFTYSHDLPYSNYGHYNQSLAHTLGSNFKESVSFIRYIYKNILIEGKLMYAIHGSDTSNLNFGNDIYNSYLTHANDYGNYVGQGLKTILTYKDIRIVFTINPETNLNLEVGYSNRIQSTSLERSKTNFIYFGIRTSLMNYYYDF